MMSFVREKNGRVLVFPSSVDGQITGAQLAKNGGNRKCPEKSFT